MIALRVLIGPGPVTGLPNLLTSCVYSSGTSRVGSPFTDLYRWFKLIDAEAPREGVHDIVLPLGGGMGGMNMGGFRGRAIDPMHARILSD